MTAKTPRAHERKRVLWDATLHQEGPHLGLQSGRHLSWWRQDPDRGAPGVGSWVVLEINRLGGFPGEVRWQDEGFAGVRFLEDAAAVEKRLQDLSRTTEM